MEIVRVVPKRGFLAIQFDGDETKVHEFLKGKSVNYNSLELFDHIKKGDWLVSTYQGVVALSDKDLQSNYLVVKAE